MPCYRKPCLDRHQSQTPGDTMTIKKQDWHNADIIAGLHKRHITLSELSRQSGLSSTTLANAFYRPWPKGEKLIAHALGIDPAEIWPSRYFDEQGNRIARCFRPRRT